MFDENYLLDKKVKIFQPKDNYHASSDAVWLSAAVKEIKKGAKILDVGSGTGAVSLCLAERFKTFEPQIVGLEIQPLLAEAANLSAKANNFDFLSFINKDIFLSDLPRCSFDYVVTNPPYAFADMPSPNLSKATAHNFQQTSLKEWIDFCIKMIKPQGHFCIVNRTEALDEILSTIHGRLGNIEIFPLYSKTGQDAKRIVLRAQKDSKAPLVLHKGFLVHQNDGSYTPEAEEILRQGLSF
ncbi:MAG: methyltransferase domain-containing protein [Alphaproteobacteria bacterium]|nr:methyltransferase domain-containing protein [Alphaproteobacteria bacterium]